MPAKFTATCSASIWKELQKCCVKEEIWQISCKGLLCRGHYAPDKPVMVELYFPREDFESFEYEQEEEFLMGINSKHFKKALDCADWTSVIVLTIEENETLELDNRQPKR